MTSPSRNQDNKLCGAAKQQGYKLQLVVYLMSQEQQNARALKNIDNEMNQIWGVSKVIEKLVAITMLTLVFITNVDAAVYECEIKDSMDVKDNGRLGKYNLGAIGSTFMVDSKKGTILGSHISNQREFAEKPQIFNSDYVKIFTFVGGPHIKYPLLLEIRQGGFYQNPKALPFTAFFLSEIYSGLCKLVSAF